MSQPIPSLGTTQSNDKDVFTSFRAHANGQRIETKSTALNIIRTAYPSHHVTEVEAQRCDLFNYAAAGKAILTLDGDQDNFDTTRTWKPVGNGIEKKLSPGRLDDDFRFARFHYQWEDKEYLVYHVVFRDPFSSETRLFYILHPRTEGNVVEGHCIDSDALVLTCGKWTSQLHSEIWVFDNGYWEKSKELYAAVSGSSWSDVILAPDMKKGLIEDVQGFFDNRALYGQYAVPWKRGIILHGVPGNGKTVSIKALINSLYARPDQISSLYVKSFETKCNTEQYSIRQIFTQARRCAPCLLIFEDLDSLVDDNIRSYFLNEVDGLESNDGILMIGSTNHLDKLDPAIAKRPSRFDRKYHFKLPGEVERTLYAEYWRQKLLAKNEELEFPEELCGVISQLTEGFSFAYLKELFVMSLLSLVRGFKGDDFEIVERDEADSAPEDTPEASTSTTAPEDEKKDGEAEVCTCASKCHTCGKAIPSPSTAASPQTKKEATVNENAADTNRSKLALSSLSIPEHLADNLLLKVIRHQIRVLHAEMDNTKTEEWPSGKKEVGGGDKGAAYSAQIALLERRNRIARNRRAAAC
ncbi:proteasome-activating nucleotidase [Lentithecium fluviatile CBS 122367]|uniref:Proteasome-activating nucleotidase n=1 Tax=Lentithecium fluviatile CBS 122367 TaxID=1168545 RepID=A0A6G1IGB5_9PLEO|nr:proteasome-activating nucleotidase [Lentithecium fluviatile CBS 122367]